MSAFIFSHEEMQQIGSGLYTYARSGIDAPYFGNTWTFLGSGFGGDDLRHTATPEQIKAQVMKKLQELYRMNIKAVNQRYDENTVVQLPHLYLGLSDIDPYEFVMLLRSFRYQCHEGDVPETKLYKELDWYIGKVCEAYVAGD